VALPDVLAHAGCAWSRAVGQNGHVHGVIDSHVLWQLVSVITGMLWALP